MGKSNIVVSSLLGLSIIGYVILSIYSKDLQVMQSVISLLVGILAGYNRSVVGAALVLGVKKLGLKK